jgi:outer membrane immunogenic protein
MWHVSTARLSPLRNAVPVLISLLGLIQAANAGDLDGRRPSYLRSVAPFNWTGLHISLSAGYAFDGHDPDYSFNNVPAGQVALLPTGADLTSNGGLVGGALGYDVDLHGVVVGLEGDISWTNFGDDGLISVPANTVIGMPPLKFATNYKLDWISTLRGRIGVPFQDLLVYGTGGLAFADVSMDSSVTVGDPPIGSLVGSTETTKVGWTLGGGAELALCDNITVKAEALYFDLGSISLNAAPSPSLMTTSSKDVVQKIEGIIGRAGIGYKF